LHLSLSSYGINLRFGLTAADSGRIAEKLRQETTQFELLSIKPDRGPQRQKEERASIPAQPEPIERIEPIGRIIPSIVT
jgi:hypothetical protein